MALRRKGARGDELFPEFSDVREIGVGSLATVYRAREIATNRLVALKLLNIRDASPRSIESFERESIALGALGAHPNIVTLYRFFRLPDGRPVLVLELCSGAVSDRLHDGSGLPVREVVAIGIKIAGALETAHRAGILHRDVKPQNILVTEFGEPALADFGVAMLQSATQTTAGLFDFTTLHAAPELLEGGGTSAATDVYELASSLYQLIAGQSAFRAYQGESPASVILRILRDPVRPLSGAEVPVALSDLLIRAMSKQMDARPHTAAEFAGELAAIEAGQGWPLTQFLVPAGGPLGVNARLPDPVSPRSAPPVWVAPVAPPAPLAAPPPTEQVPPIGVPPGGWVPPPDLDGSVTRPAAPTQPPGAPLAPAAPSVPPPPRGPEPWSVPVWAVRAPVPSPDVTGPEFRADISLDPAALRRRTVLRAGASSVLADEHRLRTRTWFTRRDVSWSDVLALEIRSDATAGTGRQGGGTGYLVALTSDGPVDLPGTRRPMPELRHVRARLDAYRIRAGYHADR